MIYRRPIREVVEERHGRTCGLHVFVFYIMVLTAMLAMSIACLSASGSGYFVFEQRVDRKDSDGVVYSVDYKTDYGWRLMCAEAEVIPSNADGDEDTKSGSGCFGLDEEAMIDGTDIELAAGSAMTADTGLAVALGHAVSVLLAATHILFFVLLYFNIDPVPLRGYLYMRGLGLMTALSSFYLLFTCVVSFFFGVKGSLDLHIQTSAGLRPSWAYVVTVINVTLMVVTGTLACQHDEVDAAIATPQYTSSSRNEDTVKRASGKLLQMRSRSSDTICEGTAPAHGQHPPFTASKATVDTSASSPSGIAIVGVMSGAHPAASSVAPGQPGGVNSVSRSSSLAASAAAHGAFGSGSGRVQQSPEPSSSVVTSWTGHASGASPASRANRASPERADGGGDEDGDVEDAESGDIRSDRAQMSDRGRRRRRDSGSILDASPLFNSAPGAGDDETNATREEAVTPKIREDEADSEIPEVNVEEEEGNTWRHAIRSDEGSSVKSFDGDTPVTGNDFGCLTSSPATQSNDGGGAKTCASGATVLAEREDAKACSNDPGCESGVGSSEAGIAGTFPDPCLSEEDALECGEVPTSLLQDTSAPLEESGVSAGDACGDIRDTTPPPSARRSREEFV